MVDGRRRSLGVVMSWCREETGRLDDLPQIVPLGNIFQVMEFRPMIGCWVLLLHPSGRSLPDTLYRL